MAAKKPLILVTNDDGVYARGIRALVDAVSDLGEVVVVAPDKPQSGMGHAVTLHHPLRLEPVKYDGASKAYACSGTPVDCVKLAIYSVLKDRTPDLVVSGINHGANSSINVIYSGTMSAAVEGAVEDIPSIGFSLLDHSPDADFEAAAHYAKIIAQQSLENEFPEGACLNVNIPNVKKDKIKGVKVCRQAKAFWKDAFDERLDPGGKPYYWLKGVFENRDRGEDTDEWALQHNYVSIVPVHYDLTAHHAMANLNTWNL